MRSSSSAVLAAAVALLLLPAPALAESAADKATAREVATEGIELFRAGKFGEALDRLRRAQALYDAPVHLLYIGRAQQHLGQLVEASESFRTLERVALPAGAPEAWVAAVDDGRKELAALEPRIPKLRIATEPASVPDATLQIDGAAVSSAVIGIARPINPGTHHVEVSAPGFTAANADVDVLEAETKDVTVTLVAAPGGAASATPVTPQPPRRALVGFMAGIRLGGAIPTGKIYHAKLEDRDLNVSDGFQAGGGFELHAGIRIARYFTPLVYLEAAGLSPGDGFVKNGKSPTNTTASAFGIGLMVATPPGKMGGFGEIELVLDQTFALSQQLPLGGTCNVSAKGGGLRFGGGGNFPVASWLHLTPFAMATLGRFNKLQPSAGCGTLIPSGDIPDADVRTHGMVFLGVGGDVVLGRDRD